VLSTLRFRFASDLCTASLSPLATMAPDCSQAFPCAITLPPDAALSPVKTSFIARTKPLVDIEVPLDAVHHFRVQCRTLRPWASLRSSRRILCRLQKHEHAVLLDGGFWNATFYMMKGVLEGMYRLKNTSRNFDPSMLPSCKW
jgi:hypothetical protein